MARRSYVRAALAAVIGLGLAAGLARAQAPGPACSPEPLAVIEGGAGAPQQAAGAQEPGFTKKGPVRDWAHNCMHKLGVGCWSHHNMYTCGSFHSEFVFVFGSCRQFFGEPCLPGPPEPPMPPGYGPPPNYLPQPGYPSANPQAYNNLLNSPGYGRGGCPSCQ